MGTRMTDGFTCLGDQVFREEIGQGLCATNNRTEAAVPEQIIPDSVPPGSAWLPREVHGGVKKIDGFSPGSIFQIKGSAGQHFVEVPGAACWNAGGGSRDESLHLGVRRRLEDALQDQQTIFSRRSAKVK